MIGIQSGGVNPMLCRHEISVICKHECLHRLAEILECHLANGFVEIWNVRKA